MQFVELANQFNSKIEVSNGVLTVDAKSIMSVMRLAATRGTVLKITADGEDAVEAADTLGEFVTSGFGPDEARIENEVYSIDDAGGEDEFDLPPDDEEADEET